MVKYLPYREFIETRINVLIVLRLVKFSLEKDVTDEKHNIISCS